MDEIEQPDPETTNRERVDHGWFSIGMLPVRSGKAWVGDAHFAADEGDGEVIELAPGEYEGMIRYMAIDGYGYCTHLRLVRPGTVPTLGPQIGETWADTGSQGICDFEIYQKVPEDWDAYCEKAEDAILGSVPGRYVHNAEKEEFLLHTPSGDGDGTFKVYELLDATGRVGFEVEMMTFGGSDSDDEED